MERTERARVVVKKKKARFAALVEAAAVAKRRRVVEPVACAVDVAGVETQVPRLKVRCLALNSRCHRQSILQVIMSVRT